MVKRFSLIDQVESFLFSSKSIDLMGVINYNILITPTK